MDVVAHGIDIVEVARVAEMCREHGGRFHERCFTAGERAYCLGRKREAEHLAARFAAKEAVMKALGTGLSEGISWTEIEVTRDGDGVPGIVLTGRAAEVAALRGISSFLVSLSHTERNAVGSVIALGDAKGMK